jgi:hypothetical protein
MKVTVDTLKSNKKVHIGAMSPAFEAKNAAAHRPLKTKPKCNDSGRVKIGAMSPSF